MDNGGETQTTEMDFGTEGTEESFHPHSCMSGFIDKGSPSSHKYYLARRTVLEMLRDRGYLVQNSEIDLTLQDFRDRHGQEVDVDQLRLSALHKDDPNNKILVHFFGPSVAKVQNIRSLRFMIVNQETVNRCILIVEKKMTSQATKALELFPFRVETFMITDLLVNITKHVLKPKHQLLTTEEKQKLLEKFSIEEKQLPRMSQKDAIAQYYAYEKGSVLKFMYSSEATETRDTYRIVW